MAMPAQPHATPAQGVVFTASPDGSRSSTAAGTRILSAALQPLNPAHADALRQEPHWRRNYPLHLRRLVYASLASGDAALTSARAGLAAAWDTLQWQDGAAGTVSLHAALAAASATRFATHTVRGEGDPASAPWTVPLRGEPLAGERLLAQITDWQQRGIIEPGAARALERCVAHPEWFDLSDRTLVLLGAGSEAGPLGWLLRWRARVVAVDVARPAVWQHLSGLARSGNGMLLAPIHMPAAGTTDAPTTPGADLLQDAPALAAWLRALDTPLDIAALAYLDGERHVRVVMAMDMLMAGMCRADPGTSLAFLATPTDVFAVPRAVADAADAGYRARPVSSRALQQLLALATGNRFFQPPVAMPGSATPGYAVVDNLVLEQGPNYALAKRIQQWRALVARAAGHRVSLNVAPSTTTSSVVRNPALAAGFAGADLFGIEVFEPATTNALMAALWVHDLRWEVSPANPAVALAHPLELFMLQACHGGLWRCPYLPRSALPFAAALGWVRQQFRPGA